MNPEIFFTIAAIASFALVLGFGAWIGETFIDD